MKSLAKSILKTIEKLCHFSSVRGHTFWTVPLNRNSIVVDLGANKGDFSSTLKNTYGYSVYAVEPNSSLTPINPDLSIDRLAITGRSGTVKFSISNNPEASSLYPEVASSFGTILEIEVRALTLTEYLVQKELHTSQISLLKLDIEGGEIDVLKTLEQQDLSRIEQITIEFHVFLNPLLEESTLQAINKLSNFGFIKINCNYPYCDDFLFINKKILDGYNLHYYELVLMKSVYWLRGIFHEIIGTSKSFEKVAP